MKNILEFLVNNHVIKPNKDSFDADELTYSKLNIYDIAIPLLDCGEWDGNILNVHFNKPIKRFVIYDDPYHGMPHIADISDMCSSLGFHGDTSEDFEPKYIIASFDTLKQTVIYAIKKFVGIDVYQYVHNGKLDIDALREALENANDSVSINKQICDSMEFLVGVLDGSIDEDDECWEPNFDENDLNDPKKIANSMGV